MLTFCGSQNDCWLVADGFETLTLMEPLSVSIEEIADGQSWRLMAHYEQEPALRIVTDHFATLGLSPDFKLERLAHKDWVAESLKGLSPVCSRRFFVAGSHNIDQAPAGLIPLTIDAGLAFGTGHHATTYGCLSLLETMLKNRTARRIIDLGTGTGLLALAAARLICRPVWATDIDPVAVDVARANARRNGMGPMIRCLVSDGFRHPALAAAQPFDLVIANILAGPLVRLAPHMARYTAAGGSVILSGLLASQERQVLSAYIATGFKLDRRLQIGEWTALLLNRRNGTGN